MAAAKVDVPRWVRTWTCIVGSVGIPGLIIASACGANISFFIAGPVATYGIYVASLAFGRRDAGIREFSQLINRQGPN
jgi:hypothetical protein